METAIKKRTNDEKRRLLNEKIRKLAGNKTKWAKDFENEQNI